MTPAQVFYISGSHTQRRQPSRLPAGATAGTAADLLAFSSMPLGG